MAISGVREVRQFGAKGDGTGDDTDAVKKAIASLPRYGGVLYFPPGTQNLHTPPQGINRTYPPAPQPVYCWAPGRSCLRLFRTSYIRQLRCQDRHRGGRKSIKLSFCSRAGLYLLSECLRLGDRPVVIRGDGVGVTRLIWTANAASSGEHMVLPPA